MMRLSSVGARLFLFKACLFCVTALRTMVFHHGTGVLDGRPPVRGMWSVAAEVITELKRCSALTFPFTRVAAIACHDPRALCRYVTLFGIRHVIF